MELGLLTYVNIIANTVICLSMGLFFVLLFGNSNSIIYKWPVLQHWTLKIALISIITTSAWNSMNVIYKIVIPKTGGFITAVNVPVGEILMNVGLASLFMWIVYFHKYHFLKVAPPKSTRKAKKKTKRKR